MVTKEDYCIRVSLRSTIAMTKREAESIREYLEDMGFESIAIVESGINERGEFKETRLIEADPIRIY